MLVSTLFLFVSFFSGVIGMMVDSPLALGGLTVLIVSGVSVIVSMEVSVFMGFILFMVVVGGMLVVFAYAVALCHGASFNFKKFKLGVMSMLVFSFFLLHSWIWSEDASSWDLFQYGMCPLFDVGWGLVSLMLCVLLLFMMIGVADICKKSTGALVGACIHKMILVL